MLMRVVGMVACGAVLGLGAATSAGAATFTTRAVIALDANHFALPIAVEEAVALTAWQFDLQYDPTDVQVDADCDPFGDAYCDLLTGAVTEGLFFQAGAPFNVLNPGLLLLDPVDLTQRGVLLAVQGLYAGAPPPPSGSGVLAYVRFQIVGTGNSDIVVVGGSVPASVPEPATASLATLALLALGRRARSNSPQARRPRVEPAGSRKDMP